MPTALITGIAGQDGSYLSELLLSQGYRVIGMQRQDDDTDLSRIRQILDRIILVRGDLADQKSVVRVLQDCQPHEVYNLAAQSFMPAYAAHPVMTAEVCALGVVRLLEAIRTVDSSIRFCQASSREMFGRAVESPQSERTPLHPTNLYAIAKAYAHSVTIYYRETYGLFACSGILFNHESPRRGLDFVTRRITHEAARIKLGLSKELRLGKLEAQRDWGYAGDYVRAMWLMLQQPQPDDYVVATGQTHTVRDVCEIAFGHLGLKYQDHVVQSSEHVRPKEQVPVVGDSGRAQQILGWRPTVSFPELIRMMVEADLENVRVEMLLNRREG